MCERATDFLELDVKWFMSGNVNDQSMSTRQTLSHYKISYVRKPQFVALKSM